MPPVCVPSYLKPGANCGLDVLRGWAGIPRQHEGGAGGALVPASAQPPEEALLPLLRAAQLQITLRFELQVCHPAVTLFQNDTAGDNGTAGGTLHQSILGFLVGSIPPCTMGGISSVSVVHTPTPRNPRI